MQSVSMGADYMGVVAQRRPPKRSRRPGRLAANTTTSASTISMLASPRSAGRDHDTMTPCENQASANSPAQNAALLPPDHANAASTSGGPAKISSAGHGSWMNQNT